jgi:hypothetical protein
LNHTAQLDWERRAAPPVAAAAILSALLGAASYAVGVKADLLTVAHDRAEVLFRVYQHRGAFTLSQILLALSVALMAPVLGFLYRAMRYRRAETPPLVRYLGVGAPLALAAVTIASLLAQGAAADRAGPRLPLPPKAAIALSKHEFSKGIGPTVEYLALLATLVLAFAIGFVAMNARRAGLLSQFMGILGVIVGVLLVIPILGPPVVQFFWFVAVGLLVLDRWPGNRERGPAWTTGEADPWPTMAELRAEEDAARLAADGEPRESRRAPARDPEPEPEREDGDDYEEVAAPAATQHPRSKKRKRKRRR